MLLDVHVSFYSELVPPLGMPLRSVKFTHFEFSYIKIKHICTIKTLRWISFKAGMMVYIVFLCIICKQGSDIRSRSQNFHTNVTLFAYHMIQTQRVSLAIFMMIIVCVKFGLATSLLRCLNFEITDVGLP